MRFTGQIEQDRLVELEELVELAFQVSRIIARVDLRIGELEQVHPVDVLDVVRHQDLAVLHDADPVRHLVDVVDAVRDEEDGHAFLLHPVHHAQHAGEISRGKFFQGFVQDQQSRFLLQGAQDRGQDPVGKVEVAHRGGRIEIESVGGEVFLRVTQDVPPAQHAPALHLTVQEKDVLGDGEIVIELDLLVHHFDAHAMRKARGQGGISPGAELDASPLGLHVAADDQPERGFSRTMLTHHRVDLGGKQGEVDVFQRFDLAVVQRDVGKTEQLAGFAPDATH